jgi:UDP-N-acetylglucosamine 4,6-dehydratase/5-epimerase
MNKKKSYFITGGTGSFSTKFIEHLLNNKMAKKIFIYSRDEYKQFLLQQDPLVKKNLHICRFLIGDIRDSDRLDFSINSNIDIVIHAAALKQVPAVEYNPFEAIKTNIIGAQNLIQTCIKNNIPNIIALSTDKAAAPINLYGATKLTSDKLFTNANYFKGKKRCKFSVVRYGNVMGSRGSVIPLFLKQKNDNKIFTITDKNMTRFNITLDESVKFVTKCLNKMKGGEIFIPRIPSYKILDVLKAIDKNAKFKIIGIRPGEKLHEEMITESDSLNTEEFKDYFVIHPSYRKFRKKIKKQFSYNSYSNKNFLKIDEIKKLIINNKKDFVK